MPKYRCSQSPKGAFFKLDAVAAEEKTAEYKYEKRDIGQKVLMKTVLSPYKLRVGGGLILLETVIYGGRALQGREGINKAQTA